MEDQLVARADCGCEIRRTRADVQDRTMVLCKTHDSTAVREKLAARAAEKFEDDAHACELIDERDQALRDLDFQTKAALANQAEADKLRPVAEAAKAAVAYILETHPQIRDAQRGWFHPSTLRLVAAVDKLAAVPGDGEQAAP